MHARYGVWCEEHQSKSKNNRELINCMNAVEELVDTGRMEGVELFFLTDNHVVEAVYYWRNSSEKEILI